MEIAPGYGHYLHRLHFPVLQFLFVSGIIEGSYKVWAQGVPSLTTYTKRLDSVSMFFHISSRNMIPVSLLSVNSFDILWTAGVTSSVTV